MKYIVYKNKYDSKKIYFITSDFDKIKDLLKEDKFNFLKKENIFNNEILIEIINGDSNNENIKYYMDLQNKCIIDKKTNEVIYNVNENITENYNEKISKLQNLINISKDLYYKKNIPSEINNYFDIIYNIEKKNNYSKIDEDIDYLEVVIDEMESYPNKKN